MKILITESQLRSLILEQQKIKVTDFCGRTKEVDYQQWYYGITKEYPYGSNGGQQASYVKCYKGAGTSFVFNDWGCEFRNWSTMTEDQRKTAIEGKKQASGCGNANRFGITVDWVQNFADYVSLFMDLIVPGSGVIVDALNTLLYLIRASQETDAQKKTNLYLIAAVSGIFTFVPGPAQSAAPAIKSFIKSKILTEVVKKALNLILDSIDRIVIGFNNKVTEMLQSPLAKKIIGYFKLTVESVKQYVETFATSVKNIINNLLSTAK